jgi:hypothetical protein
MRGKARKRNGQKRSKRSLCGGRVPGAEPVVAVGAVQEVICKVSSRRGSSPNHSVCFLFRVSPRYGYTQLSLRRILRAVS